MQADEPRVAVREDLVERAEPAEVATGATPPNWKANPTAKYAINATANDVRFIIIMWPAFFARVSPVTSKAKPTCMNSTRKPVSNSHTKLTLMRRWPGLVGHLVDALLGERDAAVVVGGRAGRAVT